MMALARHLALVGLPGSGKSTVGRTLAERLDCAFYDSDEEVERAAARSIPEIFERDGEAHFRKLEAAAIQRILERPAAVIAIGGGGFQDPSTRSGLLEKALVVWLDPPAELLVQRISRGRGRPLFAGEKIEARLAQLGAARLPQYRQAHLHVEAGTSAQMVEAILGLL